MSHIKIQVNSTVSGIPLWESVYRTDTPEQIAEATKALSRAGIVYADVWEGEPGKDEYVTSERVFAE